MTREDYEKVLQEKAEIDAEIMMLNLSLWLSYLREFGYPEDSGIWEVS